MCLLYPLTRLAPPIAERFWPGQFARARANMARVLGPRVDAAEVDRRTRTAFRNYARYMLHLLWMTNVSAEQRARGVDLRGVDAIDAALARGKGVILVTAHIGHWDLAAAVLAARGYCVHAPVDTLEPPEWNARVQGIRASIGINPIPVETGLRHLVAALKRNEVLAMVVDRPLREGGAAIRFFGRQTRVPDGAARLALRTGATIIVAACTRHGNRFVNRVFEMPAMAPSAAPAGDPAMVTQAIFDRLERFIRQYPEQWYMFREMWPTTHDPEHPS
jgi:KDO2-lipid IV(A) lauroyltransferase